MKRIFLLIATNLAIMAMLSVIIHLLGLNNWLHAKHLNMATLLGFCAVFGFGGAFLSLAISKPIAKWSTGARVIQGNEGATEAWLVGAVQQLSMKAGIDMPEVAIYEGEPNAFATGPSKNNALVAVSTGLLNSMGQKEVEAVLAHEIAHAANSDMATMTLIQGVVNTFVMFAARVVGFFIDRALSSDEDERGPGIGYSITVLVLDIVFGLLANIVVMWFSRHREFRADAGAAQLMGSPQPMIAALTRLHAGEPGALPANMQAFGISGGKGFMAMFASHPSFEERVEALRKL